MKVILGLADDFNRIQPSDSKYAAAIRHGFFELIFCIESSWIESIQYETRAFLKGLFAMAMHDRTSRALLLRDKTEIIAGLDLLRRNCPSKYKALCPIINAILESGRPICCNCLKECDKKSLRFCEGCNIECYCSVACQSASWCAGHKSICKTMKKQYINHKSERRFSKNETNRFRTLETNLLMAGCIVVRENVTKICYLLEEEECRGVDIDFCEHPPEITLRRHRSDDYPKSLKCAFISSVFYAFANPIQVIRCEKYIPVTTLQKW